MAGIQRFTHNVARFARSFAQNVRSICIRLEKAAARFGRACARAIYRFYRTLEDYLVDRLAAIASALLDLRRALFYFILFAIFPTVLAVYLRSLLLGVVAVLGWTLIVAGVVATISSMRGTQDAVDETAHRRFSPAIRTGLHVMYVLTSIYGTWHFAPSIYRRLTANPASIAAAETTITRQPPARLQPVLPESDSTAKQAQGSPPPVASPHESGTQRAVESIPHPVSRPPESAVRSRSDSSQPDSMSRRLELVSRFIAEATFQRRLAEDSANSASPTGYTSAAAILRKIVTSSTALELATGSDQSLRRIHDDAMQRLADFVDACLSENREHQRTGAAQVACPRSE
jgi:hypothetical protein